MSNDLAEIRNENARRLKRANDAYDRLQAKHRKLQAAALDVVNERSEGRYSPAKNALMDVLTECGEA
jgi:hypothetical protein